MSDLDYLIIDIDHTLAHSSWRDDMLTSAQVNWDAYHSASSKDEPVIEMVNLVNDLHSKLWFTIALTGRNEKFRDLTLKWLVKHDIKIDELLMRPDKNYESSPKIKREILRAWFKSKDVEIWPSMLVLDDRDDVVAAWRAESVTVLQVNVRREI